MAASTPEQNTNTEGGKSLKTFRKSKDLEDFYRFINENGLRREAHHALEFITNRLAKPKKSKRGRKAKTLQ
jgi:hypothetical protein